MCNCVDIIWFVEALFVEVSSLNLANNVLSLLFWLDATISWACRTYKKHSLIHSTGRKTCDPAATAWRKFWKTRRGSSRQTHASDPPREGSPREGLSAAAGTASRWTTPEPFRGITRWRGTPPVLVGLGLGAATPEVLRRQGAGRRAGTSPEMTSSFSWACSRESCR